VSRLIKSFNGVGMLRIPSGDALPGRYHVDVRYHPVRRIQEAQGEFLLAVEPMWDSVVDAQFSHEAIINLEDGDQVSVTLGGILGTRVIVSGMQLSNAE
jgi:hypothetical protein